MRSMLFSLACALLLSGCADVRQESRLVAVPRPQRPDFVRFEDGDFLQCSEAARRRLLQRHAQHVWYMKECEAALEAWEKQVKEDDN